MIKATQLRIGNLYDHSGRVKKVTPIVIEALFESERFWCKAIPLTEEWLLKLGFSEIGGCNEKDFTNGDYNIFINSIGEVNFLFFREGDWYQKISYVHQLQNLYFALTNKELHYENTTI